MDEIDKEVWTTIRNRMGRKKNEDFERVQWGEKIIKKRRLIKRERKINDRLKSMKKKNTL